ncbi:MAG: SPOR domain-containing protein [Gammaproteobacteria bacterium]|nr:SPOR domain-containing protein [Gammaproteobacteria bacterium]MCW8987259.1 SPOR domain-containing protein [Gammaproteobacteria bacterium]
MTYDTNNYNPSSLEQLNRVEPTYLAAYGLTEAPFSTRQDDRFFYSNSALTERLELLKHYTQYGNLLLIITGERGIGKSSLKQHFINTAQEEWQICEIQSHTMMDASQLLQQVALGFNITEPPHDPAALFEVLSSQLEYIHQSENVPILLIDDAHELPQDALQALLYLAEHHSDQHTTLRIILFCEPEIEVMLEAPAIHSLKERVTHSMEIPALDEVQTAEYLRHRLAVAGLDGTSPFTPKLINKIFKASEGIPARINDYAHQNLLDDTEPTSSNESDIDDELIHETSNLNLRNILLGGFALAIVVTALLFQDKINSLFEEPIPETEVVKQTEIKPTGAEAISDVSSAPESQNATKPLKTEQKTIEFSLENSPEIKIQKKTEPANTPKKELAGIQLLSINPNPVSGSKQRQIISISGTGFNARQKVKINWTGNEKILAETQVTFTSDTYINLILNVGMQNDTWKVTVIDPVQNIESNTISFEVVSAKKDILSDNKTKNQNIPATKPEQENSIQKETSPDIKEAEPTKPAAIKQTSGLYDQGWIKQQNKNYFTMQLLGTHQESSLPIYLKTYSLNNDAASFKTKRRGKNWYTLIYGVYPTKSAAQTAAAQLPKGVAKPWIRSFASIIPSLPRETQVKTAPIASAVSAPAKIVTANQEGWLWSQDPRHYTLQLAAGTDKKAIQAFIKRHDLEGKAVYFHRLRDGKDWYILVHGSYDGYSKAKQAINQLPQTVQKAKPWPRSFGAIHAELN